MRNRSRAFTRRKCILLLLFLSLLTGCTGKQTDRTQTGESGSITVEPGTPENGTGTTETGMQKPENEILESFGPDENSIVWVIGFDNFGGEEYAKERSNRMKTAVDAVNQKLEKDGRDYRLKVIAVRKTDVKTLKNCGADIVKLDGYEGHDQQILDAGLMAPLDEWLPDSKLYRSVAEVLWEQGYYKGSHYFIRDESFVNVPTELMVNTEYVPGGFPEFDGNLLSLEKHISKEHPLYFGVSQFAMLQTMGYVFDYHTGMVYKGEECVNPLEDVAVVELLRTLNRWREEGKLVFFSDVEDTHTPFEELISQCSFTYGTMYGLGDEWKSIYVWKMYAYHNVVGSTGILASSGKKAEAFALLEQIYVDRDYANTLAMCKDPDFQFGLAVGIGENPVFSTLEERNRFFEENVLPSPSLYLDFPSEWEKLITIEEKYLISGDDNLLAAEDFDEQLEKFRGELNGPMEKAIREVNASRK